MRSELAEDPRCNAALPYGRLQYVSVDSLNTFLARNDRGRIRARFRDGTELRVRAVRLSADSLYFDEHDEARQLPLDRVSSLSVPMILYDRDNAVGVAAFAAFGLGVGLAIAGGMELAGEDPEWVAGPAFTTGLATAFALPFALWRGRGDDVALVLNCHPWHPPR